MILIILLYIYLDENCFYFDNITRKSKKTKGINVKSSNLFTLFVCLMQKITCFDVFPRFSRGVCMIFGKAIEKSHLAALFLYENNNKKCYQLSLFLWDKKGKNKTKTQKLKI